MLALRKQCWENVSLLALWLSRKIKCILLLHLSITKCTRKNFFEDSKQDLLLFSASVIMGKWDRKRPGESPFSCQEKNLTITAVVSIIILHKALQLPQLYCPHLGTSSILFAFLCFDIQCTTEAFILCKKGKLMNAH